MIYRDLDPGTWRSLSTTDGSSWKRSSTAGTFGWKFDGCPEVGGALAITGKEGRKRLHALVWTGKDSEAGVWRLASDDRGSSWAKPARIGDASAKHLDMASTGACLSAVWDQYLAGDKRNIVLASSSCDGGRPGRGPSPLGSSGERLASARRGDAPGVLAAWTEKPPGGAVAWKSRLLPATTKNASR